MQMLIVALFFIVALMSGAGPVDDTEKSIVTGMFNTVGQLVQRNTSHAEAYTASIPGGFAIWLERNVDGQGWSPGGTTINPGQQVRLRWQSSSDSCTFSGPGFDRGSYQYAGDGPNAGSWWYDNDVTEPSPGTTAEYRVTCSGNGHTAADYINISTNSWPLTTVTLYRSHNGGGWTNSDVTINNGDTVALHWNSSNANSCYVSGPGFSDYNGQTWGVDWDVTEPAPGNSHLFSVTCYGNGNSWSDSRWVTTRPAAAVTLYQNYYGYWSASDVTVNYGDNVGLHWNAGNADACYLGGPGFNDYNGQTWGVDWDVTEPAPGNSHLFSVTCYGNNTQTTAYRWVTTNPIPPPAVTLYQSVMGVSGWSATDVTINYGQQVALHWPTAANASACYPSGPGFDAYYGSTWGVDDNIIEPAPGTSSLYSVTCYGTVSATTAYRWVTMNAVPAPTATLYQNYYGYWSASDVTINYGENIGLHWNSTNANTCYISGPGFSDQNGGVTGVDWDITEPAPGASSIFSVTCYGPLSNTTASRWVTTNPVLAPTVTIEQTVEGVSGWSTSNAFIKPGYEVQLRWSSSHTTSCAASGPGFGGSTATSFTDTEIDEPAAGASATYQVVCYGPLQNASDAITIETETDQPEVAVDEEYVRRGDDVTVSWDTNANDPANCSLTGPGINMPSLASYEGQVTVTVSSESVFTISCPGGSDEVTVRVLPVVQEV